MKFSQSTLGMPESAVNEFTALDAAMLWNLLQYDAMSKSSDLVMSELPLLY